MEFVEELLCSKGRIRVLRVLSENGELCISHIARSAGLNHYNTETHLEKVEELGLIREKRFGPIRVFEIVFNKIAVRFEKDLGVRLDWDGYEDRQEALS